jgi:7-carboxy-7-deazaguanine synthase
MYLKFKCYKCNKIFDNRYALAGHISHHNRTEEDYRKKGQKTSNTVKKLYALKLLIKKPISEKTRKLISIANSGKNNGNYKNGLTKFFKSIIKEQNECTICGSTHILCVHHMDKDTTNNTKENLVVLCKHCHDILHQRGYNFRNEQWTVEINEYFSSIQCEGLYTGLASHFIRLQGCSMKCSWCDSKNTWKEKSKTYDYIGVLNIFKELINKYPKISNLVITGGEPLEQNYYPIVMMAKIFGFTIEVETNGFPKLTNSLSTRIYPEVDIYNISPKLWIDNFMQKYSKKRIKHFSNNNFILKFVIDKEEDFDMINIFLEKNDIREELVFIQCQFDNKEIMSKCIEYVKNSPRKRLSIQVHKIFNIR